VDVTVGPDDDLIRTNNGATGVEVEETSDGDNQQHTESEVSKGNVGGASVNQENVIGESQFNTYNLKSTRTQNYNIHIEKVDKADDFVLSQHVKNETWDN